MDAGDAGVVLGPPQTMRRAAAFRWLGPGFVRWQEGLLYRTFRRYSAWAERREERAARRS